MPDEIKASQEIAGDFNAQAQQGGNANVNKVEINFPLNFPSGLAPIVPPTGEATARQEASPALPQSSLPPIWNVPFAHNPFFTGRADLLDLLKAQLQSEQHAAIGQTRAISGLGGIGKTQLAVEYAYLNQQAYQAVLWTRAEKEETLNASYSELATLLDLPEKGEQEQEVIVRAVKNWLQTHRDWLLILDNADQPDLLIPFLPTPVGGHVLLTTRASALGGLGLGVDHPLTVESFTQEQGAEFLLRRAGLSARAGEHAWSVARKISEELGGLPLALDQAGAYIEATGTSLDTYMEICQKRLAELLTQRRNREHPDSVAATWSLSIQSIETKNAAAAELLRFCAFLAPDAIPEEIFSVGASQLGPILAPIVADALKFNDAIAVLRAYSLINRDSQEHTLSVHRLVQFVVKDKLPANKRKQWEQRAVLALRAAFPKGDFENWSICEHLLPHILLYVTWNGQTKSANLKVASLCLIAGDYLIDRGRYTEAEQLLRQSLNAREQLLGAEHADVAASLNGLGALYAKQGRYTEAEPLFLRARVIVSEVHGSEHPIFAIALNNLAMLYQDQGKLEEAEKLHQRALDISTQQFGTENPVTASHLNNLALFYMRQGRTREAEPLLQKALAIYKRHLTPDDPRNAMALNNMASFYIKQGKLAEVEPLLLHSLAIAEKQLGLEHLDTARVLHNLAFLYTLQGKYTEAERAFQRTISIYERNIGKEHSDTQGTRRQYEQLQQIMLKATASNDAPD